MSPEQGFQALERLVRQDVTSAMVAAIGWQRYAEGQAATPPFLDEVLSVSETGGAETPESHDDLLSQLQASLSSDTLSVLTSFLQRELQAVMRLPTAPSPSVGFFDLGMDSLMAVEFRNRLNRAFVGEYVVSNTAVFDHPDVTKLSQHLSEELGQFDSRTEPAPAPAIATPRPPSVPAIAEDAPSPPTATKIAFVYAGEGSRLAGVGRELYNAEPTVRAVLEFCDAVARQERGASLLDVMFERDGADGNLDDPAWVQPVLFSIQCALTALWADIGIVPTAAMGYGVGELSAAHAAGVFGLRDGMRIALARGELMSKGADIAGLQSTLAGVRFSAPTLPLVSSVTGAVADSDALADKEYWSRQARGAAPLHERLSVLTDLGVDVVIEIGTTAGLDQEASPQAPKPPNVTDDSVSLRVIAGLSDQSNGDLGMPSMGFAEDAAEAYGAGLAISFEGLFASEERRRISIPSYPFQRRRHWV